MHLRHELVDFHQFPIAPLLATSARGTKRRAVDILTRARTYAERHVYPFVERWDEEASFEHTFVPWSAVDAALPYGFLSMNVPGIFGGGHCGPLATSVFAEEIAAADAGVFVIFGAHGLALALVLASLDLRLIARVGRRIVFGERQGNPVLLSLAHTEPGGGSDVEDAEDLHRARVVSRFARVAGGYRVTARKVFISNGSIATLHVLTACADPGRPFETMAAFLIPSDAPGCTVGRVERKHGQRLSPTAEVICDDVFVPDEDAIILSDCARAIDTVLSLTRGPVGAMSAGIIRGVLERTLAYLDEHPSLAREQWVTLALADILAAQQTARALYIDAALAGEAWGITRLLGGLPSSLPERVRENRWFDWLVSLPVLTEKVRARYEAQVSLPSLQRLVAHASIAKCVGSDLAVQAAAKAMEILGEDATDPRWGVEKCLRDAKLAQIFEGTNQINRLHIARGLIHTER